MQGFPGGAEVKASACNVGDLGLIPGLGRSPGEGNGNTLQYSCLENPMDGGAWWATVHGWQRVRHDWATSLSLSLLDHNIVCTLVNWCKKHTHWKRPWCWERLKAEGEDRGSDGWMTSLMLWTWVWVRPGSWWWTGECGVLQSMGLQRVSDDWATELSWTELIVLKSS